MDLRRELAKAKRDARAATRRSVGPDLRTARAAAGARRCSRVRSSKRQSKAEAELEEAKAALEAEKKQNKGRGARGAGFEQRGKAAAKRAKDAQALLDKASEREEDPGTAGGGRRARAAAAADALTSRRRPARRRRVVIGCISGGRGASSTRGFGGTSAGEANFEAAAKDAAATFGSGIERGRHRFTT